MLQWECNHRGCCPKLLGCHSFRCYLLYPASPIEIECSRCIDVVMWLLYMLSSVLPWYSWSLSLFEMSSYFSMFHCDIVLHPASCLVLGYSRTVAYSNRWWHQFFDFVLAWFTSCFIAEDTKGGKTSSFSRRLSTGAQSTDETEVGVLHEMYQKFAQVMCSCSRCVIKWLPAFTV